MKTTICTLFVLAMLLTACSGTLPMPPTSATVTPATPTPTSNIAATEQAVTEPTATVVVPTVNTTTATPTYEPSIAGGDFLAIAVDDLGDGWMRIRTAGNRDNCAWSNQFKFEMTGDIKAQVPHCWELRMTGTGTVKFEVKPDEIGYDTSDTLKTGLAFWPSGANGSYRVTRDGKTTDWIPLTMGPEGVNFPKDSGVIVIEFKLENGYMAMPLGEIRNNVLPQY